jgi:hypothetical protein
MTLLTAIKLINKMVKVSKVHIHTKENKKLIVHSIEMNELKSIQSIHNYENITKYK